MTFKIHTLGCKVNQYESEVISESLESAGLVPVRGDTADICVINTCAVTAESERKARQLIRHIVSENSSAYIIVTGCYAQLRPNEIAEIEGVSYVCGNREKSEVIRAAKRFATSKERTSGTNVPSLIGAKFEPSRIKHSERTRAYVKIEDGCNSVCAYCTIKDARGPVRSKPQEDVIAEVQWLAASGYREVVLTGIEISAWGIDLGKNETQKKKLDLCDLILSLDDIYGLERIRLGSLDPSLLTPAFVERLAESKKLCPHFHLSLQSGCDKTLAAMRRKYNTAMITRNVEAIRATFPTAQFTADTIVGFPGETDADFETSMKFISKLSLVYNHIFPFSRRPGTEAYDMPDQIDEQVKNERLHELERVRDRSRKKILEGSLGSVVDVLFEERRGGIFKGHTRAFIEVGTRSAVDLRGKIGMVEILDIQDGIPIGRLLSVN